jgi:hypothetical protein
MNSSLHELQSDIQRLATQQHQIQDLTAQHHLQGLVNQQQHHIQVCVTFCIFVHEFRMGCRQGSLGFDLQSMLGIFLFSNASIPALGFIHPHIQHTLGVLSAGYSGWHMRLTSHLHLVLRLTMSGTIPLLLPYSFLTCTGPAVPLYLTCRLLLTVETVRTVQVFEGFFDNIVLKLLLTYIYWQTVSKN